LKKFQLPKKEDVMLYIALSLVKLFYTIVTVVLPLGLIVFIVKAIIGCSTK